MLTHLKKYEKCIEEPLFKKMGKVVNVIGLTIESAGPDAKLGDICRIFPAGGQDAGKPIMAEVVGFKGGMTQLMPYGRENDSLPALCKEEQPEKECETQHRKRSPVSYENSGKRPSGCKEH